MKQTNDKNKKLGHPNELWQEYKKTQVLGLRDELITRYLHLVKYVAGRLAVGLPSHVKIDDMYSTGVLGLIKAIEKYDPTMKNKFETYAILLIKGAIIDEMRSLDWVPRSVHQKANQIGKAQLALQHELGREPTDGELSKRLGISAEELEDLYHRVRPATMIPLDATVADDPESVSMADRIADDKALTSYDMADRNEFNQLLEKAVTELPEQERTVLVLYYYENLMLKEIGQLMGISESRVSQIHSKALHRMRGRLQWFVSEFANMM